jgi:predicted nuclease of predicted toxin-antitoxin system
MKFLANENIPARAVRALREEGYDVAWVAEENQAASDERVLEMATAEERVVVTFDRDFGELVFRRRAEASTGVIPLRIRPRSAEFVADVLRTVLESDRPWGRHFSVVTESRMRMVPLQLGDPGGAP